MFVTLLIILLVVASAATVAAGGVVFAQRRRQLGGSPNAGDAALLLSGQGDPLLERTIRDMRSGDILMHDGTDYLVEGVIAYDEDGHRWSAGRVLDNDDERWIVVGLERGGALVVRMMRLDSSIEIEGFPPDTLMVGSTRFSMNKRGTATARISGETGVGRAAGTTAECVERCRWWLYEAPGDDTVIVEQWSTAYRVLRGTKIDPSVFELMPAS